MSALLGVSRGDYIVSNKWLIDSMLKKYPRFCHILLPKFSVWGGATLGLLANISGILLTASKLSIFMRGCTDNTSGILA